MFSTLKFAGAALVAALALSLMAPTAHAESKQQMRERLDRLERQCASLQGEIAVLRQSAERYNKLGRECEQEAREALNAQPPRFSSAALFQAQANEAYAAARRSLADARDKQQELSRTQAQVSALREKLGE